MKKLMIAAAAAAMTAGVYAGFCDDPSVAAGCLAYDVKISVKTPVPVTKACKDGSKCGGYTSQCVTYAKLGSKTLNGLLWACEYTCEDYGNLEGFTFALWEKAHKTCFIGVNTGKAENAGWTVAMRRFGQKAEKVQLYMDLDSTSSDVCSSDQGTINAVLAGTGAWDKKNGYMKSASGSVAGVRNLCDKERNLKGCDDEGPRYIDICDDFETWCIDGTAETDDWVVYGNFSIKLNKKAAKTNWTKLVPSYCICK